MKKYLSRKFLTAIATAAIDIMIASGTIPEATKPLLLQLVTAIGGGYIIIEGIIDAIKK